ncbi:MAG: hypothetical protein GXP25_05480 [Planctomycetes bacterium]|nr:hypothetical protein [Planctomycetota bacterium]
MPRNKHICLALLLCLGGALLAEEKLTLDTRAYPIGAWFGRDLESYSLGRFTAIPYRESTKEYATKNNMFLVASCGWWGMPRDVRKELIANTGMKVSKVGLFLQHNFNYPAFREWWSGRVQEIIGKVEKPENIFACKIGNEFGYHSWPEFYDYTQWTIDRYHDYLKQRHKSIAALNKRWRSSYKSFEEIAPPRDLPTKDMANWIEWRQFTCWNFAEFFRSSGEQVKKVRKSIPVSDNFYLTSPMHGWDNFELARQTDYLAYDIYDIPHWNKLRFKLDVCRSAAKAYGKPAILLEYHGGPNQRVQTVTGKDIGIESFMAIARDIRAIMYFRWAPGSRGREQGIHGLCDSHFQPTERTMAAAEFVSECQRLAPHILKSRTEPEVAILYSVASQFFCFAKEKRDWTPINRMEAIYDLFAFNHIGVDFIEPRQIDRGDLKKYKALVIPGVNVLAASRVRRVEDFVKNGGALIVHAPLPMANELGLDYEKDDLTIAKLIGVAHEPEAVALTNRAVKEAKVELPEKMKVYPSNLSRDFTAVASTDVPILAARSLGKGKILYCPLECRPSGRWPKGPWLKPLAPLYARALEKGAGITPKAVLDAKGASCDIRCLTSGKNTLVFVTNLGAPPLPAAKLTVRAAPCKEAFLITAGSRKYTRLEHKQTGGRLEIELPSIPVAALVFFAREAQPMPGMICPETCVPGQRFKVVATLDNLSNMAISGEASLAVPEAWRVKPVKGNRFLDVEPFRRASVAFEVAVPKDAGLDRWRVKDLLKTSFKIDQANGTALSCVQGIAVLPPVDFRLTYEGEVINPWQELTPPLMRWGFNTDVLTALHRTVPVAVTVPVQVAVIPNLKLGKGTVEFACDGIDIEPRRLDIDLSSPSKHTVRMTAAAVGKFDLLATCRAGSTSETTTIPVEVTVGKATTDAAAKAALKQAWRAGPWMARVPIAIGNERGALPAAFIRAKIPRSDPSLLVNGSGEAVPFAYADGEVTFSSDLPAGKATAHLLYCGGGAEPVKGMSWKRIDSRLVKVISPGYSFEFDSMTGTLRHLRLAGSESDLLVQMDTYATSQEKGRIRKSSFGPANRFAISANNVQVKIESEGPMGDLKTTKTIIAMPGRIDVTVKVGNRSDAPVDVDELGYMFVLNGRQYDSWTRESKNGDPVSGELPRGFSMSNPPLWQDFHDTSSAGMALLPVSNAMLTAWQEGYVGLRYGNAGMFLVSMRGTKLSPKDVTQSRFSLIIHSKPIDLTKLGEPSLVVSVGKLQARGQ